MWVRCAIEIVNGVQECVEDGEALVEAVVTEFDSCPVQLLAKLEVQLVFEGCRSFAVLDELQGCFVCSSARAQALRLDLSPAQVVIEPTVACEVLCGDVVGNEVALSSVGDGGEELTSESTSFLSRVLPTRFPFVDNLLLHLTHRKGNWAF